MATTYTLAGNATLRDIGNAAIFGVTTARTGGDEYYLNGKTLTIDEDTRYGKSGLSSGVTGNFHLGYITSDTTLGGNLNIDARYVRMIPFTSGSGTVAAGESIAWGSATAKVIGVYSAINVAPALTGVTTGWLKVTEWNGVAFPTSGSYSTPNGWSCTIAGADVVGFIEVVGREGATATIPRLGALNITGAWFSVGTTTGSNADTYQLPTNGSTACYFPGVFVSKTSTPTQDSDYELYPCVGSLTGANLVGTDAVRGKVCWINQSGVLRFGSDGTNSIGYVPPAGRQIVLPNVLLVNSSTATGSANAMPNPTLYTRYDFTTTGGGSINIDKASMNWYPSFSSASAITVTNTAINEKLYISTPGSKPVITNSGVGMTAAQSQFALDVQGSLSGVNITDCKFVRAGSGAVAQISDTPGIGITRSGFYCASGSSAGSVCLLLLRSSDAVITEPIIGTGYIDFQYCSNIKVFDTTYFGRLGSGASRGNYVFLVTSGTNDITLDGLSFPDSDGYPASCLLRSRAMTATRIFARNFGTPETPLALSGVVNNPFYIDALFNRELKIQRCYLSNPGGIVVFNVGNPNVVKNVLVENVYVTDGTGAQYTNISDLKVKGMRVPSPVESTYNLAYGTHFGDYFKSDTVGLIRLDMNDPSEVTIPYVTLSGGARFTGSGKLAMPSIGDSATFEMDYYALGHTGFSAGTAVTMAGGTISDYTLNYQIDKNDGAGWSAWTTLTAANLAAETGIDYTKGVKLKVRITTTTANTTAITNLNITTTTGATEQQTLYPLEVATVIVDGLVTGSMVKASKVSDGAILFTGAESSGAINFTTNYAGAVAIEARKASSSPYYRPWASQVTTVLGSTVSATAVQQLDE